MLAGNVQQQPKRKLQTAKLRKCTRGATSRTLSIESLESRFLLSVVPALPVPLANPSDSSGGSSVAVTADQVTYSAVIPMTAVTAISPNSGSTAGGTTVTISGTGFTGATSVSFGGTPTTSFSVNSDTLITATSPAHQPGTVHVSVGSSVPSVSFNYLPVVATISPTLGPVAGGTQITITGAGFTGATAVNFGGTPASSFTVNSGTQITAISPAHASGIVDVTVVTAGQTSATSAADRFIFEAASTIGLYNPTTSTFYLRNSNTTGFANNTFAFGPAGSNLIPIVGDWNGGGVETVGWYNPTTSTFSLATSNAAGAASTTFVFGPANSGMLPIAGHWGGNSVDTIGLYDPATSVFYLKNSNSTGFADLAFAYGPTNSGMLPIVGDWDGNGTDTIGLYSSATSTFYLRNSNTTGFANTAFVYGPAQSGWKPLVGDWNNIGTDTIGLYDPTASMFYLRNSNTMGFSNTTFTYGPANQSPAWVPLAGSWTSSAQAEMAAAQVANPQDVPTLTQTDLQPIVNEAIALWSQAGLDATTAQKLRQVQFVISDLGGAQLGAAEGNVVYLDTNAAGTGWFIDLTPASNKEFSTSAGSQQLQAVDPQALDRIDLLTVVEHELGHVAGLNDMNALTDDVMSGVLGAGLRRIASHADALLPST